MISLFQLFGGLFNIDRYAAKNVACNVEIWVAVHIRASGQHVKS